MAGIYSEKLLDHFQSPRNVGELPLPAMTVRVSNPACGDEMQLSVLLQDGKVEEVRYKVQGCTASIATGSALTEWMQARTLPELQALTATDVDAAIGGLIPESKHAAQLCVDAVRALLKKI